MDPVAPPTQAKSPASPYGSALRLLCVAVFAAWFASRFGPGRFGRPDSAYYLEGARRLAHGEGFALGIAAPDAPGPAPISTYAPLFSMLTAAGMRLFHVPALEGARGVLLASYVAFAIGSALILELCLTPKARLLSVPGTMLLLCIPATLGLLDSLLSTVTYGATACGSVALLLAYLERGSRRLGYLTGAAAGLVLLSHWSGLWWVMGALTGVALAPAHGLRERWDRIVPVLVGFAVVSGPWLLRNLVRTGSLMGPRTVRLSDPLPQISQALDGAFAWVNDTRTALGGSPGLLLVFGAALVVVLLLALSPGALSALLADAGTRALVAVLSGHFAGLVTSASLHAFDPLSGARFWLPSWSLELALALAATRAVAISIGPWAGRLHAAALATALVTVGHTALTSARATLASPRAPTGLLAGRWPAVARSLLGQKSCRKATNDVRPMLFHGADELVWALPPGPGAADALARSLFAGGARVCILLQTQTLTGEKMKLVAPQRDLLTLLRSRGLLAGPVRQGDAELWTSPGAP